MESTQQPTQTNRIERFLQNILSWFEKPNLTSVKTILGDEYTEICSNGESVLYWISGNCVCSASLHNVIIQPSQKNPKNKPITFTLAEKGKIVAGEKSRVMVFVDFLIVRGEIDAPAGTIHAKHVIIESTAKINVESITYEKLTVASGAEVSASLVYKEGK
jgi:hypothetical protein